MMKDWLDQIGWVVDCNLELNRPMSIDEVGDFVSSRGLFVDEDGQAEMDLVVVSI